VTQQQDYRILIGAEPFDPLDVPVAAEALAPARRATVVQFAAALSEPDADRVKAAYSLTLDRFVPNLAFLERLDDATAARVRADFLVRSCVLLDPALKLADWIPATGTPLTLIATLFDDADLTAVGSALDALGARDVLLADDRSVGARQYATFVLDNRATLPQVTAIDDVVFVEPVPEREVTDVPSAEVFQSGRTGAGTNADTIWQYGLHGEGQILGLIDKGHIDLNHCFFNDPKESSANEDHRKVLGMFDQNFPDITDHFMFVAGIVAGDKREKVDKNGKPDPNGDFDRSTLDAHRGGAYEARFTCRSLDDLFPPMGLHYTRILGDAKKLGAFIHSNSWAGLIPKYNTDAVDADTFSFENEEHVVIAAAANTNDRGTGNGAPGIAKNVLCVAAAEAFPNQMNFGSGKPGPTTDGRRKPDLMAVGNGIESALKRTSTGTGVFCDTGPYVKDPTLAATSWATPNATAAATLVRQYFTEGWYPKGEKTKGRGFRPTGALIRAALLNSTVNMTGIAGYPSNTEGWGLIQLDRTLFFKDPPHSGRDLFVNDVRHDGGLTMGMSTSQRVFVKNDQQLRITLVWTDPPAAENSPHPARNVIRLEVEDSGGTIYLGNDFDTAKGVSRPGGTGGQDVINNVQMVVVDNPVSGSWNIKLRGSPISGKQGYALVVTGGLTVL